MPRLRASSAHGEKETGERQRREKEKGKSNSVSLLIFLSSVNNLVLQGYFGHVICSLYSLNQKIIILITIMFCSKDTYLNLGSVGSMPLQFHEVGFHVEIHTIECMIFNVKPNFTELWWHESNFP